MADPSPSLPAPKPASSTSLAKLFNSPADSRVAHLNRVLSTASGIDSTLCFLGYGLVFVSSQIGNLAGPVTTVAEKLVAPDTAKALIPQLADLAVATKTLGGMCSDVRMFMRLWGLLKIWAGAKALYLQPPADYVMKLCGWGKLATMGTYLVLENQFYLVTKGVISKGWTPERLGKTFRSAIWVFFAYLCVDYVRLYREWQLREAKMMSGEKEDKLAVAEADAAWWRSLRSDLSYSPLCFHWGFEGGRFTDTWVGLLGASAGWVGFKEHLRVTAQ